MSLDRRQFLNTCGSLGFASTLLPGALFTLAARAEEKRVTVAMIDQAAMIAGIPLSDDQKTALVAALNSNLPTFEALRAVKLPNSVPPAYIFDPMPPKQEPTPPPVGADLRKPLHISPAPAIASKEVPSDLNDLAFCTVRELGELVRHKKVSSLALTEMYLERLKKYDPQLHFIITLTEDRALAQAKAADKEIAAGKYRSALHGLPWGGKDLLATKGYRTTWGAGGFEDQMIDEDATVVNRLDEAGAVLVAKLTLGALAGGDHWFGGITRNPWNTEQGSSGSSAGPASATSAGCVAFSIGSETGGSISSPSTKCGVTGFRPTFGFVPRTGAMTLSWTMDKLGPICRSVEDCALVMQAIWGPDGQDEACRNAFFQWNADYNWKKLRIGYLKDDFEKPWEPTETPLPDDATAEEKAAYERRKASEPAQRAAREYDRKFDLAALDVLRNKMGVTLIPVEIPKFPYDLMRNIYNIEGAAAFEDMTLSGRDKILYERSQSSYANAFRTMHFFPAVEYMQANRARTLAIRAMAKLFEQVDLIVTPTNGSNQVTVTNLTGHPAVIVPNGLRGSDAPPASMFNGGGGGSAAASALFATAGPTGKSGGPNTMVSLTFLGGLYKDAETCAFAHAYQQVTDFHKLHPKLS